MSNLISNANQYRHPGTAIAVHMDGDADLTVLTVTNAGRPISAAIGAMIFEPFQRESAGEQSGSKFNLGAC